MSPLSRKQRWTLLAVGLLLSAVVGRGLGGVYQRRVEDAASEDPREARDTALAESLDLERPPPPAPSPAPAPAPSPGPSLAGLGRHGRTGQDALRARMPLPPGAGRLVSIGQQLVAHGVPMDLASFETPARAGEVLSFYAHHFTAQGWPFSDVPGAREEVPQPALSATLVEQGLQLTVMVLPHEGGSTVVLGQADMDTALQGGLGDDTGELPPYPATRPLVVRARDEGLESLTVSFDTPDEPERVEDFYRKSLTGRGYALVDEAPEDGPLGLRMLNFTGPRGQHWSLALSRDDGRTAITAQGSRPQESSP